MFVEGEDGGCHVFMGEMLLRTGHPAEAAARAAFVAQRWGGSDHDEAMELWGIPVEKRGAKFWRTLWYRLRLGFGKE